MVFSWPLSSLKVAYTYSDDAVPFLGEDYSLDVLLHFSAFARSAEKDLLNGLSGKTACMLGLGLGVKSFGLIFYETT